MVVALELRVPLALRFAPDNLVVHAQDLVNVQDRYQAVARTHLAMVEPLVAAEIMLAPPVEVARVDLVAEQGEGQLALAHLVAPVDQVAVPEVQAKLAALLVVAVRVARAIANRSRERLVEKRSTIYVHQLLVVQSFRAAMATQSFGCVAVPRLWILRRRSMQMQPR